MSPKEQFIELISGLQRMKGLDELTSRLIGVLFIETKELSLKELSKRTGYSLSAVSTSMKMLAGSGAVKRKRRPGTRKAYFSMEGDILILFIEAMRKSGKLISMLKERLPPIIEGYRKSTKTPESRKEMAIIERYARQLDHIEDATRSFIVTLEEARRRSEHDVSRKEV